ncbi:pectate lyase [Phragmitibacter flavus]|uniref:Pectate lyase n=1 Tax=Phragmitibacter flavus TaxID=2576071 RepID=A0A5R8K7L3_9BACT|nr:pectate lyase [Phragmitibacter flavus]
MVRLFFVAVVWLMFGHLELSAFPGAVGFGEVTQGGRGGVLVKVTNLNASGKGSLAAALAMRGKRIVVFEVGGVIDLRGRSLKISQSQVTVAGQTAPSPGITLIRGGLSVEANDVIVRHLRVRSGSLGRKKGSGWEIDAIGMNGAARVIIDQCSVSWATDENLSASGPRFQGKTLRDWRRNTSRQVTISNCIIAEALSDSTHKKGEHSKGTLIHDNTSDIAIVGNLYASNVDRNPLAKGGVQAVIVNNWISNPQRRAVHHSLNPKEWRGHKLETSELVVVGNVLEHGRDTDPNLALFENSPGSPLRLFFKDNLAYDRENRRKPLLKEEGAMMADEPGLWPGKFKAIPVGQVRDSVSANAGARPWDRDSVDERIVKEAMDRTGRIIDRESEVGGYPKMKSRQKAFNPDEWNMETMEPKR